MELRVYLPSGDWPLRVVQATVLWSHEDAFSVEFLNVSARDRVRLEDYLAQVAGWSRPHSHSVPSPS